ncbi:MAG TPA: lysylphosphatidylglycerol synthase transmembrane domain-containing protein, partial [Tepidisphaeraceae bacterium]|nr:lysylphosphatidylglycerol synthase transmembrane domain-containing protein [Tepidisphaeraceae bacterium]
VAASLMNMPRLLVEFVPVMGAGVLFLAAVFLWILFHKQHAHSVMSGNKWGQKFLHVLDEIHHMGNWRSLAGCFGATFFYWLLQVLSVWALFKSYEMDLSIWAASVVVIIIRLGTVVPSAPGNLGVFNSVAKLALMTFGVEASTAVELSLVMWAALTLPLLIGGFVAVFLTGVSLGEIHHHARTHHARRHLDRHQAPEPDSKT